MAPLKTKALSSKGKSAPVKKCCCKAASDISTTSESDTESSSCSDSSDEESSGDSSSSSSSSSDNWECCCQVRKRHGKKNAVAREAAKSIVKHPKKHHPIRRGRHASSNYDSDECGCARKGRKYRA